MNTLPGTVLPLEGGSLRYGFANFKPLFLATRGLTLSQVCEISGTELTTVQNWIKRGWVGHPDGKRYGEAHLARILLLNMLRSGMQLEKIALLLAYCNGDADDRADDSVPDAALYSYLCTAIADVIDRGVSDTDTVREVARGVVAGYQEPFAGAREKLENTLVIMTLAFLSGEYALRAQALLNEIL